MIETPGNVPITDVPAPSPRRDTIKPCKVVRAVRELPVGTAAGPEGAERSRAAAAYAFSSAAPEAKLFQILNVLKVFMSWPLSAGLARSSTSETSAIAESPSSGPNCFPFRARQGHEEREKHSSRRYLYCTPANHTQILHSCFTSAVAAVAACPMRFCYFLST